VFSRLNGGKTVTGAGKKGTRSAGERKVGGTLVGVDETSSTEKGKTLVLENSVRIGEGFGGKTSRSKQG